MQLNYKKKTKETTIVFGEILSTSIKRDMYQGKHIIIFTNQRYYDRFFDKIQRLFSTQTIDWYVCSNLLYSNHVQEMMDILHFLEPFSPQENYLFIGFGNEGVMQLTGFLQQTTILKAEFWALPVSLQSYAMALMEERYIYKQPMELILKQENLPTRIFLDQTIIAKQNEGKLVDLQIFVRAALVCDYPLLHALFRSFSTTKQLHATSFTVFVEGLTQLYQKSAVEIDMFGKLFEEAFYITTNGHLLSENMKRFLGMLLHLFWNLEVIDSSFHIKNFMIWLKHLGFPIDFPSQISVAEYLQNVLHLQDKYPELVVLSEIGTIGVRESIKEKQLIQAIEHYQKLVMEI
ncbi:hypothetical protein IV487_09960 [Enterococcus saccharolyticus]|uniref:3-dehydroquinate synthase domain-containing protein n=1 Tax=Candidatus Enterococcus willemsii TaxID=1857215 RepID=A0ABQ6Z1P6_9ENTE|nr:MULTISPECIES: hypothetical protein [Enterococcus]KAF1305461.1 hypothetical protein BAU17_07150 [Enterococcus sp. CU12B]MCD5002786.1 hypothetical protein [Enterococcus saccharolyticus]